MWIGLNVPIPKANTIDKTNQMQQKNINEKAAINEASLVEGMADFNNELEGQLTGLHKALELANIPILLTDYNGIVSYCTHNFEKILSIPFKDIKNNYLPKLLLKFIDFDDFNELESSIKNFHEWEKVITIDVEEKAIYKKLTLIPNSNNGKKSFVLTSADVTGNIQKIKLIRRYEKQLNQIINNTSDLILVVRKRKNSLYFENANEKYCKVFNINQSSCFTKLLTNVLDYNGSIELIDELEEFQNSKSTSKIFDHYSMNRHYSVKVVSIDSADSTDKFFIVNLTDNTEKVRCQNELQSALKKHAYLNMLKTGFLENMSHEIRTPFNAMMGYAEIIDECTQNGDYETIKELTLLVRDVLKRILNLFNNIVDVSQIESGDIEIEQEKINANEVIREIFNLKKVEAVNKNIGFILLEKRENCIFITDKTKFEKVINALIDNAIKYTEVGEVYVIMDIENGQLKIEITDTGRGINEHQIKRILEPFSQEEEGYTRKYEGAGLGLTLASKFTKLLGGTFILNSKKGNGTTILIYFPC